MTIVFFPTTFDDGIAFDLLDLGFDLCPRSGRYTRVVAESRVYSTIARIERTLCREGILGVVEAE